MTTYRDESGPGDTTTWLYDLATGLLVQKLYEDGKGPSYTYTPDGKLATRTWARGVATTYAYDGWGNLTNIVHSDGTPSISMAYDVMGRQIQTSDAAGVTAFAYDSFSSLTNETVAGQYAKSLDRYYDECGRNVGFSLDGQRTQTVAYDPATGRISTMDGFAWQYLPGSDLKQTLTYPNGTVAEWVYEPRRDLLTLVSNDVFSAYAYENDAAGRRVSKNTERYGYNVRGELIAATNTATAAHYAYTFDTIGNRIVADELGTNIAYSANALNQYTNIVSTVEFHPEFDDDGNQTLVKTSTGIWQVTYNAENRPVVWSNGTAVVTMDFDRMGRRVWYASVSGGETNAFSKFVYDGYLCVQKLDGTTGNIEQEYVWDPTETVATRPLTWTLPGLGRTFHYFHDGNKNVSDVIDASDGSLAAHYDYAPFGAVTVATGPMADANPYRFSSEYHDAALGCVTYNYRHYNPLDGRWMTRDPVGERGGAHLYGFLGNSQINRFDVFGLLFGNWYTRFRCKDCPDISVVGYEETSNRSKFEVMARRYHTYDIAGPSSLGAGFDGSSPLWPIPTYVGTDWTLVTPEIREQIIALRKLSNRLIKCKYNKTTKVKCACSCKDEECYRWTKTIKSVVFGNVKVTYRSSWASLWGNKPYLTCEADDRLRPDLGMTEEQKQNECTL